MTGQTTQLRDRCLSHFADLKIPIEAAALDEIFTRAEKESLSARLTDIELGFLLGAQVVGN
jgi:hypothetical protein